MKRLFFISLLLLCGGCKLDNTPKDHRTTIEVAVFEGGYGLDWHRAAARNYERLHPEIHINLWGDPRVDEKLKPRILRGDPPDLASCRLPVWKLIVANKLYPLNEALDSPAIGQPGTWRNSLVRGVLTNTMYQGKEYSMPTNLGAWVCWYDRRMFRQHGWKEPHDWDEFLKLCEEVKAAGIAPLAYQGKYPTYAWFTLLCIYQRLTTFEHWYALEDLQPGAFKDPQFIEAARKLQELAQRDFEPGALAMSHTESQMEWVNGRAAMVFCGLWLKNEMKKAIPPEFEMACFPVPPIPGGAGDPRAIYCGGAENFFVFSQGKHPREAADFLKYMMSMEPAQDYIRRLDSLTPVRNSTRGQKLSPALQSAVTILDGSSRIYSDRVNDMYVTFQKGAMQEGLSRLVSGKCTPEQFGAQLEQAAEEMRHNPEVYIPPPMGVPPG